jgi:hypothetical protein
MAGSIATLITCPLDVVKTRMQAFANKQQLTGNPSSSSFGLRTLSTLSRTLSFYQCDLNLRLSLAPCLCL